MKTLLILLLVVSCLMAYVALCEGLFLIFWHVRERRRRKGQSIAGLGEPFFWGLPIIWPYLICCILLKTKGNITGIE